MAITLPDKTLIDTSVLIRALRNPLDEIDQVCNKLWNNLLHNKKHIYISVLSVAELLQGNEPSISDTEFVHILPFDIEAAKILASQFSRTKIKQFCQSQNEEGQLGYFKYDALILATAKSRQLSLITRDDKMIKLAKCADINGFYPNEF